MGLGILDDHHLEHVPGTTIFHDDPNAAALSAYDGLDLSQLKHGTGRNSHIVLVPQPTDDPNDPLNWPRWKKHMVFLILVYGTTICNALGPLVASNAVAIALEYNRSLQAISHALGSAVVLTVAFATIAWSILSIKFGKRPVFLASSLIMLAGSILGSYSKTYNILLGSRIIQGVGLAVSEFLVGASLADIYFTHERGIPVALWNLALLDGINVTPPIAGQVIQHLGWLWTFKIFSIAAAILLVLQFFCLPETTYHRSAPQLMSNRKSPPLLSQDEERKEKIGYQTPHTSDVPKRKTYLQELSIYNGFYSNTPPVTTLLLRPAIALMTPVCLWAGLLYGVAVTWLVLLSACVAQIFSSPPFLFSSANIGLTYMSPFIGAMAAALLGGPLTDYIAKRMSRANNGIFEPEYRLVLILFYAIFGAMGFFGWGISAGTQDPWIVPVIFFGVINFGIIIGCSAAIGYVVDAHRQSADSALGGVVFFKNIFSLIITLFVNDWLTARGILNVFGIVGGIIIFTSILTIPMYIYGKRARSWIHRNLHFDDDVTTAVAH